MNTLYFGDNLSVLREHVRDESVDLVYLDPPFNSNATYNVLFDERNTNAGDAQLEAFRDTWEWGPTAADAYDDVMKAAGDLAIITKGLRSWLGQNAMMAYLAMMAVRLLELRRVLKPTGSLYLHCDPKASHYLKLMLDAVFGHENFRNEVIWKRTSGHSSAKRFGPVHDTLLFYTSSDAYTWNRVEQSYDERYLSVKYRNQDSRGKYRLADLTAAGPRTGDSGRPWREIDPTMLGRHWAAPVAFVEAAGGSPSMTTQEKLDLLDESGFIYWPIGRQGKRGFPQIKRYLTGGLPVQDVIDDIAPLNSMANERLGYPTQKPVALLRRLLSASSNEGDVVLDPFCGCGTTVEAAEGMNRRWIGIDVTHYAVTLIEARLAAKYPQAKCEVQGRPVNLAGARDLARRDKHQFQWWAAWRVGAQTYREEKKGADRGIDGNLYFKNGPYGDGRIIVSVKGGENVSVQMVRDLRGVIEREEAEMGVLVTLANPTKSMMDEASAAGFVKRSAHGRLPRLQVVRIESVLAGHMPALPPLPVPEKHPMRAPRRQDRDQLELLLPFPGERIASRKDGGTFVDPRFFRLA